MHLGGHCVRFRYKARPDQHGRPVPPGILEGISRRCDPLPFVVSPVDVDSASQITRVSKFDLEYGDLIRSTPEYRGLGYKALRSVLARRSAIHLDTMTWVPDPIFVSAKVLSKWLDENDIADGIDDLETSVLLCRDIATSGQLEEWWGELLRRRIAFGFTGYRAMENYVWAYGMKVSHNVVREWHNLYRQHTPEDTSLLHDFTEDAPQRMGLLLATEADLQRLNVEMRKWYHVQGLSMVQVAMRLREHPLIQSEDKSVTYGVVKSFYRRNRKYEFEHWQQLLQQPVIKYLQDLKEKYNGRCSDIPAPPHLWHAHAPYLWYEHQEHQPFFKKKLWEDYAVSCNFRVMDLHKARTSHPSQVRSITFRRDWPDGRHGPGGQILQQRENLFILSPKPTPLSFPPAFTRASQESSPNAMHLMHSQNPPRPFLDPFPASSPALWDLAVFKYLPSRPIRSIQPIPPENVGSNLTGQTRDLRHPAFREHTGKTHDLRHPSFGEHTGQPRDLRHHPPPPKLSATR